MACGGAQAADWKLTTGINVGETYSNNIALAPSGSEQSDWVTEITPNFSAVKTGARFKADIHYAMQNLFYARDSSRNQTYHQLDALTNTELWRNEVFLDASANIRQVATSILGAKGVDNINATGNNSSVRTFTLSPYWLHRFGSTANLNARYSVTNVSYADNNAASSLNTNTTLSLASGTAFAVMPWALNYSDRKVDYSVQPDVEFKSTSATLGYVISPQIMVNGTLGYEQDSYVYTGSKPQGRFWNVNLTWAVSPRTKVEGGLGNHYYGNTKFLAFTTHGGFSEWRVDYNEGVTTSNSLAAQSGIAGLNIVNGVFDLYTYNANIVTNLVFLNKRFGTAFNWKKGRNELSLAAYHATQTTNLDQTTSAAVTGVTTGTTSSAALDPFIYTASLRRLGFNANAKHAFTPLVSGTLTLMLSRTNYTSTGRSDKENSLQLGLERKLSSHMVGRVGVRHQARQSDQDGYNYSENSVSGSVNYTF